MSIWKKPEGWVCKPMDDGSQKCVRVKVDKDQKFATGTDLQLTTNEATCETFLSGSNSMLDDDSEAINDLANKMTTACRKRKGEGA
jgi:hypothetical protein